MKVNSFKLHVVSRSRYAKHAKHVCIYLYIHMYARHVASENQESRWGHDVYGRL